MFCWAEEHACSGHIHAGHVQAAIEVSLGAGLPRPVAVKDTNVVATSALMALSFQLLSYTVLHVQGNWLRSVGVAKGDAVAIYMPLICELPIAMLACARIGAVHSVVFGGFSAEALAQRIQDCK